MILSIIVAIFCGIGIYGFYNGLIFLAYIGMVFSLLEQLYGFISGQQKSLFTVWICVLLSIGSCFAGNNFFNSLAILLCYENVILFILGIITLPIIAKKINNKNETSNRNENFDDYLEKRIVKNGTRTNLKELKKEAK